MKKIVFEERVYSFQTDFVGHLSNIVYIQWMEIGRTKLLEQIGLPFSILTEKGIAPVLVETSIRYRKSLHLDENVKIEIWVSQLREASAIMSFNFFNSKGELAATGNQKGLFIHRDKVKPYRLTPEERKLFEKVLIID